MSENIHPGYRGIAYLESLGTYVRFADANISAKQEVNAPDMIMGDWDHDAYVYGKIEVGGTISGPATETFASSSGTSLWDWAVKRYGTCGTLNEDSMKLWYYCGEGRNYREFTGMLANSVNFSCAAGDIANFSIDVMGKGAGSWGTGDVPPHFTTAEKVITWDKVKVTVSGDGAPSSEVNYSNFEFTINNNLEPVYSLSQSNLFPVQIIPGLRTITGSLSVYNIPTSDGYDKWDDYIAANVATIQFEIYNLDITMRVRFHRVEPASAIGPIISTLNFTGVTHQTGSAWEG